MSPPNDHALPKRRAGRMATAQRSSSLRLTERDRWLLEGLVKMRFATTTQISRLFFSSHWGGSKRLRRLFDAGLVRVWLRSLAEENVYSITRSGLSIVRDREAETDSDSGPPVPRGLDGNLEHLLAINNVRIALASTLPAAGGELAWWRSDWDLRAVGKARLVPDALFAVRWDGRGDQAFSLELDYHTKSSRRFLAKILRYTSALHAGAGIFGVRNLLILVVGSEPAWLERYRSAVAHARLRLPIWFATLGEVEAHDPTTAIWATAFDERRHSLRDLPSPPYGREGRAERIAGAAQSCAPPPPRLHPSQIEADQ